MLNLFKICPPRSVCLVSVLTNIKVAALNTFFIQMLGKEIQFCKSFFFSLSATRILKMIAYKK